MTKPNLFSIGAMRAGSTTIYHYLSQHPEIFLPDIKEPYFFVAENIRREIEAGNLSECDQQTRKILGGGKYRTKDAYDSLYKDTGEAKYIGDCSHYLHHPATAKLIHEYNPNAKILVSLRNPVQRIYSEYSLYVRRGSLSESFPEFINKMLVKKSNSKYEIKPGSRLEKGMYANLLPPWIKYFNKDQLKIILFDDLTSRPNDICQDIYTWLNVDNTFTPETIRAQRGGVPKSKTFVASLKVSKFIPSFLKKKISPALRWKIRDFFYSRALTKEKMCEETEQLLKSLYLPHISQFEELLGTDLSSWK